MKMFVWPPVVRYDLSFFNYIKKREAEEEKAKKDVFVIVFPLNTNI